MQHQTQEQKEFIDAVNANKGVVWLIINKYIYDHSYHDDLFQEILYQAWKSFGGFKGRSKFSTWLAHVAKNTVVQWVRRMNVKTRKLINTNIFYEITDEPYYELSLPIIDTLTERERKTLDLYISGKSYDEIADIMGEQYGYVRVRMNRIKNRYKKYFNDKNFY